MVRNEQGPSHGVVLILNGAHVELRIGPPLDLDGWNVQIDGFFDILEMLQPEFVAILLKVYFAHDMIY